MNKDKADAEKAIIKYEAIILPAIIPDANNSAGIANGGLSEVSLFSIITYSSDICTNL